MTTYSLSASTKSDLRNILRWSLDTFGSAAAKRYSHLLVTSFEMIGNEPRLRGSREFESMRLYHLRLCRKQAALDGLFVKQPRHFVLYRTGSAGKIEIIRALHDNMDIDQYGDEDD